jgi:hypothetical protein
VKTRGRKVVIKSSINGREGERKGRRDRSGRKGEGSLVETKQ